MSEPVWRTYSIDVQEGLTPSAELISAIDKLGTSMPRLTRADWKAAAAWLTELTKDQPADKVDIDIFPTERGW